MLNSLLYGVICFGAGYFVGVGRIGMYYNADPEKNPLPPNIPYDLQTHVELMGRRYVKTKDTINTATQKAREILDSMKK